MLKLRLRLAKEGESSGELEFGSIRSPGRSSMPSFDKQGEIRMGLLWSSRPNWKLRRKNIELLVFPVSNVAKPYLNAVIGNVSLYLNKFPDKQSPYHGGFGVSHKNEAGNPSFFFGLNYSRYYGQLGRGGFPGGGVERPSYRHG